MIQLNGHRERWFAGAGALGLDGFDAGHPPLVRAYKWPFRAAGLLDPYAFTVITKTVTRHPREGRQTNWGFHKYARPILPLSRRSMVNAVALTNPGFDAWEKYHYRRAVRKGIKLVLSLHVHDEADARDLARRAQSLRDLAGVQINAGCPNLDPAHTDTDSEVAGFTKIVNEFQYYYGGPLLIKFRLGQPWPEMAASLEGRCAGYELVNACPWDHAKTLCLTPAEASASRGMVSGESPLARYGVGGSVSGGRLSYQATMALVAYKRSGGTTPIMSGGGVVGHESPNHSPRWQSLSLEVGKRFTEGADAVVFSTAFLWNPAGPNRVVREYDVRFREDTEFLAAVAGTRGYWERERAARRRSPEPESNPPPAFDADVSAPAFDGDFPTTDYGAGSLD